MTARFAPAKIQTWAFVAALFLSSSLCCAQCSLHSATGALVKNVSDALSVLTAACPLGQLEPDCRNWFINNPETIAYARCSGRDQHVESLNLTETCARSIGDSWVTGLDDIAVTVETAGEKIDACEADTTLKCKKELAAAANFSYRSDAELRDTYAGDLLRKRAQLRDAALTDTRAATIVNNQSAHQDQAEASGSFSHGEAKVYKSTRPNKTEVPSPSQLKTLMNLADTTLRNLEVRKECYNSAGYTELSCFALGSVFSPTKIMAVGLKGLKGIAWASRALRAAKASEPIARLAEKVDAADHALSGFDVGDEEALARLSNSEP